jgi:hypothetical protein
MFSKLIEAFTAVAIGSSDVMTTVDYQFMDYVSQYGKSYGTTAEFEFRKAVFAQRLEEIEELNSRNGMTSTVGINMFSDYTPE